MKSAFLAAAAAFLLPGAAQAVVVQWADLTAADGSSVFGTIDVEGESVSVTYEGGYHFANTGPAASFWAQGAIKPYTGGIVENAPPTSDIIALGLGGAKTIRFGRTVSDVYLALVSWNGNSGTFDQPFEVISQGCGAFGCGSFTNVTANSFTASGELHGVIRFTGSFDQVTFTDNREIWHGIQIGIGNVVPNGVPEPATWAMMIAGFGLAGTAARRRRARVVYA